MSDLNNCPFCGRKPNLRRWFDKDGCWFIISCPGCGTEKMFLSEQVAIEKWNTRPAEDALTAEIERLKEALHSVLQNAEFWDNEDDSLAIIHRIAIDAIGKDTNVPANAPDMNDGKME